MNNWKLTRADTGAEIEFPQDLRWFDEFDWSPVAQSNPTYTIGGAMVIQKGIKTAGRPITLGGEWAWLTRGQFKLLQSWASEPDLNMTLTHYDGTTYSVIFRNHEKAIDCEPVNYQTPESDDDPYTGNINLITIA